MVLTEMQILIRNNGKSYNVMVSADRYVEQTTTGLPYAKATNDRTISDHVTGLYMTARREQTAAVVDFLNKNADKMASQDLKAINGYDYNGGHNPTDFEHGISEGGYIARLRTGNYFEHGPDFYYMVVHANGTPQYQRMMQFTEVAISKQLLSSTLLPLDPIDYESAAALRQVAPRSYRVRNQPAVGLLPPLVTPRPRAHKRGVRADLDAPHLLRHIDALLLTQHHV